MRFSGLHDRATGACALVDPAARTRCGCGAEGIRAAGGVPKEFNTIAVDDGIAMGHEGMMYSFPLRERIADACEYMANAHAIDAMI